MPVEIRNRFSLPERSVVLSSQLRKCLQKPNDDIRDFILHHLLAHARPWPRTKGHEKLFVGRVSVKKVPPSIGSKLSPGFTIQLWASIQSVGAPYDGSSCLHDERIVASRAATTRHRGVDFGLTRVRADWRTQTKGWPGSENVSQVLR